jgi:predicted TPR repeat methyltransferase
MTSSHHVFVSNAFGPLANEYLTSAVHASGEDLDRIEARVRGRSTARALDLGCGGGHVCYRVAPHVAQVIALDISPQMLETVSRTASERGLYNIIARHGDFHRFCSARGTRARLSPPNAGTDTRSLTRTKLHSPGMGSRACSRG